MTSAEFFTWHVKGKDSLNAIFAWKYSENIQPGADLIIISKKSKKDIVIYNFHKCEHGTCYFEYLIKYWIF